MAFHPIKAICLLGTIAGILLSHGVAGPAFASERQLSSASGAVIEGSDMHTSGKRQGSLVVLSTTMPASFVRADLELDRLQDDGDVEAWIVSGMLPGHAPPSRIVVVAVDLEDAPAGRLDRVAAFLDDVGGDVSMDMQDGGGDLDETVWNVARREVDRHSADR